MNLKDVKKWSSGTKSAGGDDWDEVDHILLLLLTVEEGIRE
jgi:hypothetical protein